jgi:Ca2+-binding RTX toxin-like protein
LQSNGIASVASLNAGSGTIDLTGGTFSLTGANQINASSTLDVDGGTFDIGANNQTVAQLIINGGTVNGSTGVLTSTAFIDGRSGAASAVLPQVLDASAATFEGTAGAALSGAALLAVESKLHHFPNDPSLGLIVLRTNAAYLQSNNLIVIGTNGPDNLTVNTSNPANVLVSNNGRVLLNPAGGPFNMKGNGGRVIIFSLGGNDFIQTPGAISEEVHCGNGNDTVYGGNGNDVFFGGGNDFLHAGNGDAVLIGGAGKSYLVGGSGNDLLIAGQLLPTGSQPFPTYSYLETTLANWKSSGVSALSTLFAEYSHSDSATGQSTVAAGTGHDALFSPDRLVPRPPVRHTQWR